jgi:hypothetical protein
MSPDDTKTIPTSQKRIEANRRNAARSTGPRTAEGKARSRLNGLKHGLAAKVPVLPGEDAAEFQAHVAAVVESYGPENRVELELLERVAATAWSLDRVARAEAAQLRQRIGHEAIEREGREQEGAIALGQRLLWDARGPWQVYPHHPHTGLSWEKRVSWSEDPADPNSHALLVCRLERTVAGCRWLLDRWAELLARLEPGDVWAATDQFKAVRLLGKQPLDAVDDQEVTQIFLASASLLPEGGGAEAFAPVKSELRSCSLGPGTDDQSIYSRELKKRPLSKLRPADADAAREVLRALVDRQMARLELILARNQEIAEADAAEASARLAFDSSPEGEIRRRYALSAARLINQTLGTFVKIRKGLTDSAGPAESGVVSGPLSVDADSVVGGPLSVEELSVASGPLSVDGTSGVAGPPCVGGISAVPGPLSVDGTFVVAGPPSVADEDHSETPDSAAESRPRHCSPVGIEASRSSLQTEPNHVENLTTRAWEQVLSEKRIGRLNRVFGTLVEQENAQGRKKKGVKPPARKS